jgi:hypothetical protein
MAKVGGGLNPMHLSNDAHPFEIGKGGRGAKATSRFAHTTGVGANPGGQGDKISANSARKKVPGSINGPGVAK